MNLQLEPTEARFLRDLLDRAYGDIKYEISDTDDSKFKVELHREKDLLEALLARMTEAGITRA